MTQKIYDHTDAEELWAFCDSGADTHWHWAQEELDEGYDVESIERDLDHLHDDYDHARSRVDIDVLYAYRYWMHAGQLQMGMHETAAIKHNSFEREMYEQGH